MREHPIQWQQLQSAVANQRVPQSMLFVGPLHCTISVFIVQLTQLLLCQNSQTEPCNNCLDCRMVAQMEHPDVEWIKPEKAGGAIKIDQIRELQQTAYLTPQRSNHRIIIIEAADRMNNASANSLLKILEEPAQHTLFILNAQQLSTVLPTVLSRCQIIRFSFNDDSWINNMLLLGEYYPLESERSQLMKESESILDELIAIIEGKQHPCILAAKWSKYDINNLIWFLYLVFAQLQNMHSNKRQVTGPASSQLFQLVKMLDSILIFKQIDKINLLLRKLSHNIHINHTLALEDLLLNCSTIN